MRERFTNAVIDNMGKLIAGLVVTIIIGVFTTIVIEPVTEVVNMPGEVRESLKGFEHKQQEFEARQILFMKSLESQSKVDSMVYKQLEKLNKSNDLIQTEVAIVKTKIATIRDELPSLHQRFNDIENTVRNSQYLHEIVIEPTHTNIYNNEYETTN